MARGRMIDQRFTQSEKLNGVPRDHRLVYASILPYLDRQGRMCAEPMVVKVTVFRRSDFTIEEIAEALASLAKADLIRLYSDKDNEAILEYANFLDFNSPNSRERKSDYPGPDDSGALDVRDELLAAALGGPPESPPTDTPRAMHVQGPRDVQGNGTERERLTLNGERKELSSTSESEPGKQLAATPPRENHNPDLFMEIWNTNRGRLPGVTTLNDKRRRALKALIKEHGPAEAAELFRDATRAVAADPFWIERQYGFDNLMTGKVLQKAEQWRAGAAQLGAGNVRLASNIERWARALPPDEGVN